MTVLELIDNPSVFMEYASSVLYRKESKFQFTDCDASHPSAVLFMIGMSPAEYEFPSTLCLILNKRSQFVKQPGDLCCPGGSISYKSDALTAFIMRTTSFLTNRWKYWRSWKNEFPDHIRTMTILLAAGLREGYEEMRLNPFNTEFLGLLPAQKLVMFDRKIYPLVVWIKRQHRFVPNWEVERIVWIPLRLLLESRRYKRYRIDVESNPPDSQQRYLDYPCFQFKTTLENELLWGATYRIVLSFLDLVFDFRPPDMMGLPQVNGHLEKNYWSNKFRKIVPTFLRGN